jgi:hypothetical protein
MGKARDARRGTRQARGYGVEHQARRAAFERFVKTGLVDCSRCGERITSSQPWALDHTDDRTGYLGPSHKLCNDRAGGIAAHQ